MIKSSSAADAALMMQLGCDGGSFTFLLHERKKKKTVMCAKNACLSFTQFSSAPEFSKSVIICCLCCSVVH